MVGEGARGTILYLLDGLFKPGALFAARTHAFTVAEELRSPVRYTPNRFLRAIEGQNREDHF